LANYFTSSRVCCLAVRKNMNVLLCWHCWSYLFSNRYYYSLWYINH
jgi:hypothetical protein